jgi:predicted house-cleaning NTP pyrophosphatase (Maf/HAM1 superfamily)
MAPRLVLASASPFRKMLLENAGSDNLTPNRQSIDERAVEATH